MARRSWQGTLSISEWEGSDGMRSKYPQCKTGWGFVLLWPAWLIPGTSDSTVSGTMIKYTNKQHDD